MLSPLCAVPLNVGEIPKSKKTSEHERQIVFNCVFPFGVFSCLFDLFSLCCVLTRVSFPCVFTCGCFFSVIFMCV